MVLLALAGCVPVGQGHAGATEMPTGTPRATPTAAVSPTPTATLVGVPVTITCDQLITAKAMYTYNSNFGRQTAYTPASGSVGAQAVSEKGIACSWINQTSGDTIEVAVAHLQSADSTAMKNDLVMSSKSVPTYQVEGYFSVKGTTGVAQAFPDPYWLTATSTVFLEPGDAQPLVAAAIAALG